MVLDGFRLTDRPLSRGGPHVAWHVHLNGFVAALG